MLFSLKNPHIYQSKYHVYRFREPLVGLLRCWLSLCSSLRPSGGGRACQGGRARRLSQGSVGWPHLIVSRRDLRAARQGFVETLALRNAFAMSAEYRFLWRREIVVNSEKLTKRR